tara:strand:+ start:1355 stop:2098 length:744 start_codon:yes stop_codon:yes gene_type:complete
MKKIIATIAIFLGTCGISAAERLNVTVGLSGTLGLLDATAKETVTGTSLYKRNNSNSETVVTNKTSKTTSKSYNDMPIGYGAVFAEFASSLLPGLRVGVEYVPYDLDSETTENARTAKIGDDGVLIADAGINKVNLSLEAYTTGYLAYHHDAGPARIFVRAGIVNAQVITNESLSTGSVYGNTSLDGTMFGLGFEKDIPNGLFVRGEVNQTDFDGLKLTGTGSENVNTIDLSGLSGRSALVSVGKNF